MAKHGRWVIVRAEILGANDRNFHKSALMDAVATIRDINSRRPGFVRSTESLPALMDQLNASSGGISGVGGGGDGRILSYMKMIYLELFYRLDRKILSATQFQKVARHMERLDVEFSDQTAQGTFTYDRGARKLRFPNDPTVGSNDDLNANAIVALVDSWLKELDSL